MNVTTSQPAVAGHRVPQELVDSSAFLLKRLGFAAKERTIAAYERSGLHPSHHAVLAVLDEGSRETQGSIADALGYDRGMLVGLLDELEERDLVERKRDPNDRRRHLVRLTPEGKKALKRLRAISAQVEDDFFAALDAEERAALHDLLHRLAQVHEPRCAPLKPA
jgi:DNA-binding MarR family transcriptional regulator